jgi:hypothetical protein
MLLSNSLTFLCAQIAIIVMNLFTGPPLFRAAVIAAGEGRLAHALSSEFEGDLTRGRSDIPILIFSNSNVHVWRAVCE